jgi:hypothetical protein
MGFCICGSFLYLLDGMGQWLGVGRGLLTMFRVYEFMKFMKRA